MWCSNTSHNWGSSNFLLQGLRRRKGTWVRIQGWWSCEWVDRWAHLNMRPRIKIDWHRRKPYRSQQWKHWRRLGRWQRMQRYRRASSWIVVVRWILCGDETNRYLAEEGQREVLVYKPLRRTQDIILALLVGMKICRISAFYVRGTRSTWVSAA